MAIRCEYAHRLELRKFFLILGCCGNVASVPKDPFISYSRSIVYFEHAFPLSFFCLTGKFKKTYIILWTCSHFMAILRSQDTDHSLIVSF